MTKCGVYIWCHLSRVLSSSSSKITKSNYAAYIYACLYSPTKSTLVEAIRNGVLIGFLGVTTELKKNIYFHQSQQQRSTSTRNKAIYILQKMLHHRKAQKTITIPQYINQMQKHMKYMLK